MEDALDSRTLIEEPAGALSDAIIAERAKNDPHAFGVLYERYYPRVYRYAYHRVGNEADAEDITAMVFMKALEALPTFQTQRGGFAPWLFRISRNAVIDYYRRRKRQQPLEAIEQERDDSDPVADVLGNEQRAELQGLIRHLSPEQREVVIMRFSADLSFAEIAATLKKNETAVRMLLHRGLRKMKSVLDHERTI